jgi:hypothetical protein
VSVPAPLPAHIKARVYQLTNPETHEPVNSRTRKPRTRVQEVLTERENYDRATARANKALGMCAGVVAVCAGVFACSIGCAWRSVAGAAVVVVAAAAVADELAVQKQKAHRV